MRWVWQPEEGQEPDNSTLMCVSSSDSEEIHIELPCAGNRADVMKRPDRSCQFCLCFVTDRGRDLVTRRVMPVEHSGQYFCLLLWCTEYLYNPWQRRVSWQHHGIIALPGHRAIKFKKKKKDTVNKRRLLCNFGSKPAWPWTPRAVLWIARQCTKTSSG